jgi:phosphosulfolactate phosphohydrolase-like enzyme
VGTARELRTGGAKLRPGTPQALCLREDLRNAAAVAEWVQAQRGPVSVIACGERWPDGSLRPTIEDLVGAGAILARLNGRHSPEAEAAVGAFRHVEDHLDDVLMASASGCELIAKDWAADVAYAAEMNVSTVVPVLNQGVFISMGTAAVGADASEILSRREE